MATPSKPFTLFGLAYNVALELSDPLYHVVQRRAAARNLLVVPHAARVLARSVSPLWGRLPSEQRIRIAKQIVLTDALYDAHQHN